MERLVNYFKELSEKLLTISQLLDLKEPLSVSVGSSEIAIVDYREEFALTLASKYIHDIELLTPHYKKLLDDLINTPADATDNKPKEPAIVKKPCKTKGCEGKRYGTNAVCYECYKARKKKNKVAKKSKTSKPEKSNISPKIPTDAEVEKFGFNMDINPTEIAVSVHRGSKFIYNALKRCYRGSDDEFYTKEKDDESGNYLLLLVEYTDSAGITESVIDLEKVVV